MAAKLRVVCATKQPSHEYFQKTALGCSLSLPTASADTIELRVFCDNREGLASAYNQAIDEAKADSAVLVFVHDDVQLCDFHWPSRILRGLESFHIVGVAGNKRRIPRQPSWAFIDPQFTWDALENLSGTVGHGSGYPPQQVSVFGPSEQEVKLLDGLLLAVQSDDLHATDLRFDQRFAFHFYDLDFCREAELRKLTMGTCSISLVHASGGQFDTPEWTSAYAEYLRKWKD